jgi:hypothetical protein
MLIQALRADTAVLRCRLDYPRRKVTHKGHYRHKIPVLRHKQRHYPRHQGAVLSSNPELKFLPPESLPQVAVARFNKHPGKY